MRLPILAACLGLFLAIKATPAAATDGNTLHRWCENERVHFSAGLCDGYIVASMEALLVMKAICPPDAVTNQQIIEITTKFLKDNPARRHDLAQFLIRDALRAPFPCRN